MPKKIAATSPTAVATVLNSAKSGFSCIMSNTGLGTRSSAGMASIIVSRNNGMRSPTIPPQIPNTENTRLSTPNTVSVVGLGRCMTVASWRLIVIVKVLLGRMVERTTPRIIPPNRSKSIPEGGWRHTGTETQLWSAVPTTLVVRPGSVRLLRTCSGQSGKRPVTL